MAGLLIKVQRFTNTHNRFVWLGIVLGLCLLLYVATNIGVIAKPSQRYIKSEAKDHSKKEETNKKAHKKRNNLPDGWKFHFYSERDQDLWEDVEKDTRTKLDLGSILRLKPNNASDKQGPRLRQRGNIGQMGERHPEAKIIESPPNFGVPRVGPKIFNGGVENIPVGKAVKVIAAGLNKVIESMEKQPKLAKPGDMQPPQPGNRAMPAAIGIPGVHGEQKRDKRLENDGDALPFGRF